jgi:hypothetical protein
LAQVSREFSSWWNDRTVELRPLLFEWDPIGLGDDLPDDEYDSYANQILTRLARGAQPGEIERLLLEMAKQSFELPAPVGREGDISRRMVQWYEQAPPMPPR